MIRQEGAILHAVLLFDDVVDHLLLELLVRVLVQPLMNGDVGNVL